MLWEHSLLRFTTEIMFFRNIFYILFVFCNVIACFNVLGRMFVAENEIDDEDVCVVDNVKHKIGESWSILGECNTYKCLSPNHVTALTCASAMVDETSGCKITEMDLTKLYPDCCPKVVCPPTGSPNLPQRL
ncbi:U-scoloptoxin(16)-Sm1a-like [Homalodisca vitripennis]|uniref:U-scoloptoxin(16)-Sm1a-like n=1 Tax=Homalodisca vitripennis TaxID=197043 RepID=UPI001EEB2164|nr:U-scoloptoxin(16)-Sm1a-like [Homalodisca vitripennis]